MSVLSIIGWVLLIVPIIGITILIILAAIKAKDYELLILFSIFLWLAISIILIILGNKQEMVGTLD